MEGRWAATQPGCWSIFLSRKKELNFLRRGWNSNWVGCKDSISKKERDTNDISFSFHPKLNWELGGYIFLIKLIRRGIDKYENVGGYFVNMKDLEGTYSGPDKHDDSSLKIWNKGFICVVLEDLFLLCLSVPSKF